MKMFLKQILLVLSIFLIEIYGTNIYGQCTWTTINFDDFEASTSPPFVDTAAIYGNGAHAAGSYNGALGLWLNVVNGGSANQVLYNRPYAVCPGQSYRFQGWIGGTAGSDYTTDIYDGTNINGMPIATITTFAGWNYQTIGPFTPASGTITMVIRNNIAGGIGNNDFQMDDLSFQLCDPDTIDNPINICPIAGITPLFNNLTSAMGTGGSWSGPSALAGGHLGNFDPATMTSGTYFYTILGNAGCPDSTQTVSVSLGGPSLSTTSITTCPSIGADITTAYADNNNTGGTVTYWQDPLATIPESNPTNIMSAGTYYIVMNAGGCADTASVVVSFSNLQAINFGPDTLLCQNYALTLDAGAGFDHYLWNDNSTNQTLTTNTAGTYWAQGSVTGGNLIINGDFELGNTGFNTNYIVGTGGAWGPISNPGTYLVTTNANLAHNNFSAACVDNTSGTGNMMVVNGASVANQNVWCQTVPINPNTNYEFSTWVQNYNAGAQLAFFINGTQIGTTFTPSSTMGCTWQNFFQLWNSGTSTTANICIVNQSITGGGNDFALDDISFAPLCTSSDTIVVTIDPGPVTTVPADASFCTGDVVAATAFTSAPTGGTFNWLNSNTAIGLANAAGTGNVIAFTANNATASPDTATIGVYATLNNCSGDTAEYLVIVNPTPVLPSASSVLICINNTATLTATAPGGTYEWYDAANGGNLIFTGSTYTTPVLTVDTTFWVQATNSDGCTGPRRQVDVTIGNGLIVDAGLDVDICDGQATALVASPNTAGNTYVWSEPGGSSIPGVFNPSVTPNDTTLYTVEVTDAFGCIGIDSVTVNVKPTPAVTVPLNTIYCNGDPVPASNYTSVPAGADFSWTSTNPNIGLATLSGSTANGNPNTPAFTAANSTTQVISSTIAVTPTYIGCVGNVANYTISVNPIPTITALPADEIFCVDHIIPGSNISGTPQGLTFSWINSNTAIGLGASGAMDVPTFTATNAGFTPITGNIVVTPQANGCTGTPVNYDITVSPRIIIDKVITDATCFGYSDGSIRAIASGGTPGYSYNWSSGHNDSIANNLPADSVTITVTDINGCIQDSTFFVNQPDSIDYITFYADPTQGCSPLEVKFTCSIDPSVHLVQNYVWDFGNNRVPQDSFVAHSGYIDPGTYDVSLTVTDYNGCSNTLTKNDFITVFEDPEAHFYWSPEEPQMLNPTADFRDISHDNIVAWEWSFDTLGNNNAQNPTFTFPEDSGTYPITLIVENSNSCRDTLTQVLEIRSEIALFLPNSFTPNGDGLNDLFMPKGFGVALDSYSFLVFNRWGELVFETNDITQGWDGSFNGEMLPSGIYVWRMDYNDLNGNEYRKKGQINLHR